jgi:hypothetical protein
VEVVAGDEVPADEVGIELLEPPWFGLVEVLCLVINTVVRTDPLVITLVTTVAGVCVPELVEPGAPEPDSPAALGCELNSGDVVAAVNACRAASSLLVFSAEGATNNQ